MSVDAKYVRETINHTRRVYVIYEFKPKTNTFYHCATCLSELSSNDKLKFLQQNYSDRIFIKGTLELTETDAKQVKNWPIFEGRED